LVPVLFTFYIQGVLKLKKNNSGAKRLRSCQSQDGNIRWNCDLIVSIYSYTCNCMNGSVSDFNVEIIVCDWNIEKPFKYIKKQYISTLTLPYYPVMWRSYFLKNEKPTRFHLIFYFTSYRLNMFRTLLCPSSGARDYDVDYHIGRIVLGLL